MDWAVYQFTNKASDEFISFIDSASENELQVFKNTPIIVVLTNKVNELNILLVTDIHQFNKGAPDIIIPRPGSIITAGINLSASQKSKTLVV